MKKLLVILAIGWLGWLGWQVYIKSQSSRPPIIKTQAVKGLMNSPSPEKKTVSSSLLKCDGRTFCSQMKSCEEATFFLKNCPNVKMDGNNDGIPCEKQWCK